MSSIIKDYLALGSKYKTLTDKYVELKKENENMSIQMTKVNELNESLVKENEILKEKLKKLENLSNESVDEPENQEEETTVESTEDRPKRTRKNKNNKSEE